MRKAMTALAVVALVAGVALVAVSLSQSPSALAQETEREVFFEPLDDVLNDLVDDQVITEDQRERIATAFEERIVRFGREHRGTPHLETVADTLDMAVDELVQQLRDGATIADIAGDQTQAVIDALVAEQTARLEEAVSEERISQEKADEIRSAMVKKVEAMVNGEQWMATHPFDVDRFHGPRGHDFFGGPRGFDFFDKMPKFDRFGFGGGFGFDPIAEALGLETDELIDRLTLGSSLDDIAEEQGVEIEEIVNAVLADLDEKLQDLIADERLTQERADEIRAGLEQAIESMIKGEMPGFDGFHFEFKFDGEVPHFRGPDGDFPFHKFFDHPDRDLDNVNGAGTSA